MAFMSKFCFSCSVRLGSAITGIFTLVQASVLLGIGLSSIDHLPDVQQSVTALIEDLHLEGRFYKEISRNPQLLLILSSVFFSCLICACVLLLYGCFQCKTIFLYPFVFVYLLYILGLFVTLIALAMVAKIEGHGLGDLILYSNIGGFILLFYLYTWACVVSLIQIINELRSRLKKKLLVVENMKITNHIKIYKKNNTKGLHNHARFN